LLRRALAAALIGQGRYEAALPLLDGPAVWGCYDAGRHQMLLAEALHGLGRTGQAEAAANEALQAATVLFAPGHPRVLQIRTLLARIRASPAEMRTVAADWASHLGPDHPGTRAAREAC
jgi:hypothetical protein